MNKLLLVLYFLVVSVLYAAPQQQTTAGQEELSQEAESKMMDFSLSGYGQAGKKTWEVKGNSADIFTDIVRLNDVNAKVYGDEEVHLVGDRGAYDKTTGKMHLEDNIVITTQTGGKLTTDTLDWDRASQKVTTDDLVNIEKQNLKATGIGMTGEPNLKKVALHDAVSVEVNEQNQDPTLPSKEPTIITCTGPLEIDYQKEIATFYNNVKVHQKEQGDMYGDKMDVYFDFKNKKILSAKLMGNVKIVKGDNTSYSDEATYTAADKKMVLTGKPRLVIYSEESLGDAPSGN